MSLRDEIAAIIRVKTLAYHGVLPEVVADRILAKVREAMLSNQVQAPIRQELHDYPRTSPRDTVKTVIEMALDAVTTD